MNDRFSYFIHCNLHLHQCDCLCDHLRCNAAYHMYAKDLTIFVVSDYLDKSCCLSRCNTSSVSSHIELANTNSFWMSLFCFFFCKTYRSSFRWQVQAAWYIAQVTFYCGSLYCIFSCYFTHLECWVSKHDTSVDITTSVDIINRCLHRIIYYDLASLCLNLISKLTKASKVCCTSDWQKDFIYFKFSVICYDYRMSAIVFDL